MKESCTIHTVNPKLLSDKDFEQIYEVSQDLWAHGIDEFVQCTHCEHMMGKKDIFGHLEKEIYDLTTQKIMRLLGEHHFACQKCHADTDFVYGDEHISKIKQRLLEKPSHIVVAKNENGDIVGYMDGYLESMEGIFQREYETHYRAIGVEEVKRRIHQILGFIPEQMLGYSGVGLIGKHSNFFNIFSLMRMFYKTIDVIPEDTPAFTELDLNNNFHTLFHSMGYESLGFQQDQHLAKKITNVASSYNSELVVFRKPIEEYRRKFGELGIKGFLKMFPNCIPRKQPVGV